MIAIANNIRGITIQIDADTKKLGTALKDVNKQSTDINKELRQVNNSLKFNPKDTILLSQKQKLLGDQVSNTKEKLDRLKQAEAQVQEQFKRGDISQEQYRAFQREIAETESKLKHYEKQLREVSSAHEILGRKLQETGKGLQDIGKKLTDTGKNLSKKVTLPIVGVGAAASKLGIDFEKSMSEVQAVTGATGEELEQLEKAARDAGSTTDKSARDAADALKYMGLAGWDVAESQNALLPMLKLSSAANMDLGRTSDLVTDTMSALGLEINDLDGYLDILAQTSRNSNTGVDQLGEAFLTVGGKLKSLGIEVEDGAVALGLLADNGIKGSEAGRGLNAILTNLTAPTGRAKEALDELNVSAFDSKGEFIGLEETLELVANKTNGMTQEQQNMYMSMIAGKEHSKTFLNLMDGLGGGFDDLGSKVYGADGALNDMYDTATNNTMGAINNLKSAVEELGLKIFDSLQPHIEKLVNFTQKLTDKFNGLSPKAQENIIKIGLLAAAIGPLLLIIGTLAGSIGNIISLGGSLVRNWDKIKAVGGILSGGLKSTVGFIFSPAGAIMLGIAAVIAIGVALYRNWDTVKAKAGQLGSYISSKFNQIRTSIEGPINKARDAVKNAVDKIKGFFNFKLTIPKPKIPKISISGKFSLAPPSVPKISWNADGGIFKSPTVLPTMAGLQGFAEPRTGGEAIMPLNKLPGLMAKAMEMASPKQTAQSQPIILQVDGKTFAQIVSPYSDRVSGGNMSLVERGLIT